MQLSELLASIDLSNNGYLFVPSGAELAAAKAHPEVVDIRSGRIYRCTTPTEFFPSTVVRKSVPFDDGIDYEGAILARQERWLFS